MKKFQLFLTYYSILIVTSLFLWSLFHLFNAQGFLLTLLLIPVCLYFGLLVTGTFSTKAVEERLPFKILNRRILPYFFLFLFTLFISSLNILLYSLIDHATIRSKTVPDKSVPGVKAATTENTAGSYEKVTLELNQIKSELNEIKAGQNVQGDTPTTNTLNQNSSSSATSQGFITLTEDGKTVPIYQEKNPASRIIGEVNFGVNYFYTQKDGDWYFLYMSTGQTGWIRSPFVKETY